MFFSFLLIAYTSIGIMSAGPLVVEIICTCLLAAYVLHRYSDVRKQRALVTLTTFIAWYFSFMIIFILPLDVSSVSGPFLLHFLFLNIVLSFICLQGC